MGFMPALRLKARGSCILTRPLIRSPHGVGYSVQIWQRCEERAAYRRMIWTRAICTASGRALRSLPSHSVAKFSPHGY